jgi:uncharacterized protein
MVHIGLLSDTHSYLNPKILEFFQACDEIWHAGDIGSVEIAEQLADYKPLKAVWGNIDNHVLRQMFPENLRFTCENIEVWITHIGGYPGRYNARILNELNSDPPDLFITGHSHILKVVPDKKRDLLHMNPGAAGKNGFHNFVTAIRFVIEGKEIRDLEVLELKR